MKKSDSNIISTKLNKESFMENYMVKKLKIKSDIPSNLLPIEIPNKLLNPVTDGFLKGFTILDNKGIRCDDEEVVENQSGIISDVVKQLSKNIFKGAGTMTLSLPIKIFSPKTQQERDVDIWAFAPTCLKKAGQSSDIIESLLHVTSFALSSLYFSSEQSKPFNPYLGETYQAVFEDGTKIYLEHTSHTPCISNVLMLDKQNDYKLYGYFDLTTDGAIKMIYNNSLIILNKGKTNVYLKKTNRTVQIMNAKANLSGLVLGDRIFKYTHFLKIEDRNQNLIVLVYFDKTIPELKNKRVHDIYGGIYKYDFSKGENNNEFYEDKLRELPKESDRISIIEGSYLEEMIVDRKSFYNFKTTAPTNFYPIGTGKDIDGIISNNEKVLYSDARYREDLIWLKRAFIAKNSNQKENFDEYSKNSGEWKLALEAQQRHDRHERKKNKERMEKEKGKEKSSSGFFGLFK